MGGRFLAPGPPKLTFIQSKRYQFLFILSMEQDGVFQKILTSRISLMNIFLGHPVCVSYKSLINLRMSIAKIFSYNYNHIIMLKRNVWAQ